MVDEILDLDGAIRTAQKDKGAIVRGVSHQHWFGEATEDRHCLAVTTGSVEDLGDVLVGASRQDEVLAGLDELGAVELRSL